MLVRKELMHLEHKINAKFAPLSLCLLVSDQSGLLAFFGVHSVPLMEGPGFKQDKLCI